MRASKIIGITAVVIVVGFLVWFVGKDKNQGANLTGGTATDIAYFEALRTEKFTLSGQEKLDVDGLIALIPENVSVTYSNSAFDAATGATTLNDISITMADDSTIGVKIGQLSLWGVDKQAISDRVSGQRLQDTILIANRVEAENLSMFGLESILKSFSDATNEMAAEIVEDMTKNGEVSVDLDNAMPDQSFDKFEFKVGRTVLTDVTVHPWILELTDVGLEYGDTDNQSGEDLNKLWHWVQKFAAWSHVLSYANSVSYDVNFHIEMSEEELPFTMAMSYELMGYRDINRGDTGFGIVKGSRSLTDLSIPLNLGGADDLKYQQMKSESSTEYYTMEDINMSGVFNHLARGEFPDRTETDLMSFGVMRSGPSWSKYNDVELLSMESAYFDMSEFHWLVPETIEMGAENVKFNIAGFIEYIQSLSVIPSDDPEEIMTDEQMQVLSESIKILEKYNLAAPVLDFAMGLHWNAKSGEFDMGYSFDIDNFLSYDVKTDLIMPNYDAAMAVVPENLDAYDEDAFREMILKEFAFKKYHVLATDKGGLEKGFAMAVDFAQLAPEDEPGMAMLRSSTPEILRNMATNAFIVPMSEVSKIFPPGVAYLQAMSDFIGKGGSLEITAVPEKPLYVSDIEALVEKAQANPDEIVDILGLEVVHTEAP